MKASLAYIDDVMDRAVEAEHAIPTIPANDREKAAKGAKKLIGGFRVHDHEAETKALDAIIAKRRANIDAFRKDRAAVREVLKGIGITPLAVCPSGAWYKVLRDAGLFVLSPDSKNRVYLDRKAFESYVGKSAERNVDAFAAAKWGDWLKALMPDGRSLSSGVSATLILPDPPADVADTLVKAQSLKLTVAAVSEAISFAEKPSELLKAANSDPRDIWAREQGYEDYQDWVKRDPIVFTEHGTATAIIAQFGDFPIEQEVVDAAVKADTLLADKPQPLETLSITSGSGLTTWIRASDLDDSYRYAMHSVHLGTPVVTSFKTFEIDAPEIESFLNQGGSNEDGTFLLRQIVGVEEVNSSLFPPQEQRPSTD